MNEIYPRRVVVTNNRQLIHIYNKDPESALMASHCVTVEHTLLMLQKQISLETIILVNGEGEEIVHTLGKQHKWNKINIPAIERIDVPDNHENASIIIREALVKYSRRFLWTKAGAGSGVSVWVDISMG